MESELVRRIRTGDLTPGQRLQPAREICQHFNLTYKQAVSVIQRLQRKGYVRSVRGSGTYVCDVQVKAKPLSVVLGIRTTGDIHSEFTGHLLSQLRQRGIVPGMVGLDDCTTTAMQASKIDEIFEMMLHDHPSVVVLDDVFEDRLPTSLLEYERRGGRIILLFRHVRRPFRCAAQISPDSEMGLYLATRHLLACGYDHVAVLTRRRRPGQDYRDSTAAPLLHGYYRAMREARPKVRSSRIMLRSYLEETSADRVATIRKVLESPDRPRAIVAERDALAHLVFQAAEQVGLGIPEDLAVCGCLDVPIAKVLDLTTVRWDWAEMAGCVMTEVDRSTQSQPNSRHIIQLSPTLVVRTSCGCAAGEGR